MDLDSKSQKHGFRVCVKGDRCELAHRIRLVKNEVAIIRSFGIWFDY